MDVISRTCHVADAVRAADDKGDVAPASQGELVKAMREVLARALLALDGKQDDVGPCRDGSKDALPLPGARPSTPPARAGSTSGTSTTLTLP